MNSNRFAIYRLILVGAAASQSITMAGPGFSTIHRKTIHLEVRKPALVRLANTSVAFQGGATNQEYQPVLVSLLTILGTEIVKNEKTLVLKSNVRDAEWTLYMNVTGYSAPNPTKSTQRTGNAAAVTDHWTGSLNVAYRVLDRQGRVHDADNVKVSYDKTSVEGAGKGSNMLTGLKNKIPGMRGSAESVPTSTEDLKQILIHKAVEEISSKLGNTSLPLQVRIATGEDHLNRAGVLMEQKLWARALQELESTAAFPGAEDESYRLYDLGVVYEAISYEAKAYKDQRTNLFLAQEMYDKAMESNRKEKYFVETVARLRDSIARYKTLDDQQKQEGRPPAGAGRTGASTQAATSRGTGSAKANTVGDMIKLHKADIPKDQIIEIIKSAPLDFNPVDVQTVLAIKEANLPIEVQNEMRKKVGATPVRQAVRPAASSPPATPKKQTTK